MITLRVRVFEKSIKYRSSSAPFLIVSRKPRRSMQARIESYKFAFRINFLPTGPIVSGRVIQEPIRIKAPLRKKKPKNETFRLRFLMGLILMETQTRS